MEGKNYLLLAIALLFFCYGREVYASNAYYVQGGENGQIIMNGSGDSWMQVGNGVTGLPETGPVLIENVSGAFGTTTTDQYIDHIKVWMASLGNASKYYAYYGCPADSEMNWSINSVDGSTLTVDPKEEVFYFDTKNTNCNLKNFQPSLFAIVVEHGSSWPENLLISAYNDNPKSRLGLHAGHLEGSILDDYDIKVEIYSVSPQDQARKPVLIVPGVLGTDILKGSDVLWANLKMSMGFDGFMDPLAFDSELYPIDSAIIPGDVIRNKGVPGMMSHYTDGLIKNLVSQGYIEGVDLFTFPYDWRYGVSGKYADGSTNVGKLKGQIDYILTQTADGRAAGKVDVIAHSTGGLLVKKYVLDHIGDHNMDKVIFVGVPNLGAPKSYKVLAEGDNFGVPGLDPSEMKKIAMNMPVIYDLAPSEKYFQASGSVFTLHDPFAAPEVVDQKLGFDLTGQLFIDKFSANSKAMSGSDGLHTSIDNFDMRSAGINFYNIVGCKTATFGSAVANVYMDSPDYVLDLPADVSGDGTVPLSSAESVPVDTDKSFYILKVAHSNLLSSDDPSKLITSIVSGKDMSYGSTVKRQSDLDADTSECKLNGKWHELFSPINIDITDNNGNHTGMTSDRGVEIGIPGSDFQVWGEHKFVFLPTDDGQTYSIKVSGIDTGTFTMKIIDIVAGKPAGQEIFGHLPVTRNLSGTLSFNSTGAVLSVDQDGDGSIDQVLTPTEVILTSAGVVDNSSPTTSANVKSDPGSVVVALTADDGQGSGVADIFYRIGDSGGFIRYSGPVSVNVPGNYDMEYYSIDRSGNVEPVKNKEFTVPPDSGGSESGDSGGQTGGSGQNSASTISASGSVYYFHGPTTTSVSLISVQPEVLGTSTELQEHGEGDLIVFIGDPTVYLIMDGLKHPFFSASDFLKAGFKFEDIQQAVSGDSKMLLGMPFGYW